MPLPVFWILIFLSVVFYLGRKRKLSKFLGIFSIMWLFAISTPLLPDLLISRLEDRYPVFNPDMFTSFGSPVHIVVLGGGHVNDDRLPANDRLSSEAVVRIAEGIRIHRKLPGSIIITSGWSSSGKVPQAEVLAETALLLGVDENYIKKQPLPKNTRMEASEYHRLFGDNAQIILVTSAVHMRRAIYAFQEEGLDPVPAPTNHLIKKDENYNPWIGIPSSGNIRKMESAVHEYVGFLWYKLTGN
jgi:uncharacterized SAM-binding protein YcdF (DUF218 family)